MPDLVAAWNQRWTVAGSPCRVVGWFHKTGNFLLDLPEGGAADGVAALQSVSPEDAFAVFDLSAFELWVSVVRQAAREPPPAQEGRRWTPGVVMNLALDASIPPLPPSPDGVLRFGLEAQPRLRVAWKHDLLRPGTNVLDPQHREGGWGRVAKTMQRHAGGEWTARALSRIEGLLAQLVEPGSSSGPPLQEEGPRTQAPTGRPSSTESGWVTARPPSPSPPHLALMAARREAEQLVRVLCQRSGLPVTGKRFLDLCHDVESRRLLTPRSLVYLHSIRRLGNLAAHPETGSEFTGDDADLIAALLRAVQRELSS
jgi:hypothetical protein